MEGPVTFKSAVGGFDKRSVMNYIFELNESSQAAQKRLTEQLEEVSQAREALDQQLAEANKNLQHMQSEMENLNTQLAGEKSRTGELTEMVEKLNSEIEKQKQIIAQKDAELRSGGGAAAPSPDMENKLQDLNNTIASLRGENERMRARISELQAAAAAAPVAVAAPAAADNSSVVSDELLQRLHKQEEIIAGLNAEIERQRSVISQKERQLSQKPSMVPVETPNTATLRELEEKQRELDRASAQIGRLLLDATADAEKIRSDAQLEGERIVFRANREADNLLVDAQRKEKLLEQHFASLRGEIDDIQRRMYSIASEMQVKADGVGELIDMTAATERRISSREEPTVLREEPKFTREESPYREERKSFYR